jgi:hypothetical protein
VSADTEATGPIPAPPALVITLSPADLRTMIEEAVTAALARARPAAQTRPAATAQPAKVKTKPCLKCSAPIAFGAFGDGRVAVIEPASLAGGYDTVQGKFGPTPHFEKQRGHQLHTCR